MIKKNKIELLNENKTLYFVIDKYFKNYFLKKGYKELPKNLFLKTLYKFIYLKILRFPKLLFNILKNSKFIFNNPKNCDYIIYDDVTKEYIEAVLKEKNYFVMATRIERINNFYFSKDILFYILKNIFRRSFKQNYLAALIKVISPKSVITHIDNSVDFSITSRIFKNDKIKFIAIQNAGREGEHNLDKFYLPNFYVFGNHYKNYYESKNVEVNKFYITGSLRANAIKKYLENKNKIYDKNKYDICLISEPLPVLNFDFKHIDDYTDIKGKVAKYTHLLCKKNNLNLVFSGKYFLENPDREFEKMYYKKFLGELDFNISSGRGGEFSSYFNIMQSKLIIGVNSTLLQESIVFKKKFLSCNFFDHEDFNLSFPDECTLRSNSFEDFEKKVMDILSENEKKYFERLSDKFEYIMRTDIDICKHLLESIE